MQTIEGSSRRVRAIYEYAEEGENRLPLFVGDVITLIDEAEGWFEGYNESGRFGWFPQNFVEEYFCRVCSTRVPTNREKRAYFSPASLRPLRIASTSARCSLLFSAIS